MVQNRAVFCFSSSHFLFLLFHVQTMYLLVICSLLSSYISSMTAGLFRNYHTVFRSQALPLVGAPRLKSLQISSPVEPCSPLFPRSQLSNPSPLDRGDYHDDRRSDSARGGAPLEPEDVKVETDQRGQPEPRYNAREDNVDINYVPPVKKAAKKPILVSD